MKSLTKKKQVKKIEHLRVPMAQKIIPSNNVQQAITSGLSTLEMKEFDGA